MIDKCVALFLRKIEIELEYDELDEENIENADEMKFIINFENGKNLSFRGELCHKYFDFISGMKI